MWSRFWSFFYLVQSILCWAEWTQTAREEKKNLKNSQLMKANTDKRVSCFISELEQIGGGALHFYSCKVMPCEIHRDAPKQGTQILSTELQQQGFPALLPPVPQPTPSEGFVPCYQPHSKQPQTQTALWPSLPLGAHRKLQVSSLKFTQTFKHTHLFPIFFPPPDI